MAKENVKPLPPMKQNAPGYTPEGGELKVWNQFRQRKQALFDSRRNIYGMDIDQKMREWDSRYFNREAEIPASEMDVDQRPLAINNAFGKIQAALGILLDRNPEITLDESNPKYSANRELIKGLAQASWKETNSLGQFKLSVYNCAKRGWFVGRTFHYFLKHDARFLKTLEKDEKTGKEKKIYETKEIVKMDDVAYRNINNYNAWLDEQTIPEDFYSTRDWMWRDVQHIDDIKRMFPEDEFPNMKYVVAGGDTRETVEGVTDAKTGSQQAPNEAKQTKPGMTEMYFYENQYDDWFIVEINGVMVVWEPMPQNSKRISCTYGYWNLRSAETIYGIGIVEEMERNEKLIDRILNMTMRQLLMTIAPPGFYTGTEEPEDENIKYKPGVLRRTLNPKDITFLQIPEGNQKGMEWIGWLENKSDAMTGITKALEGDPSSGPGDNDTAFALGVNREAGLKRLKIPLKQLQYALDWEFRNRVDLIKQTYNDFKVERIVDEEDIMAYLEEVGADPDYYFIDGEGDPEKEQFFAKRFREKQLNLEQDDETGAFVEAQEKKFFKIKPEWLSFEGDVTVDVSSMLVQSEELEKADTLRLANIIVPLITQGDPTIVGRPVKQLLLAFNKDPRKWLPDLWLQKLAEMGKISKNQPKNRELTSSETMDPEVSNPPGDLNTIVPQREVEGQPSLSSRFGAAFRAFKTPAS